MDRSNTRATVRERILVALSEARSIDEIGKAIVENCSKLFDAEVCTLWRRYRDDDGTEKLRLLAASAKAPQTLAQEITYEIHPDTGDGHADGVTGYVAQTMNEVHVASFEELKSRYGFCWRGRMDPTQWEGDPEHQFRSLSAFPLALGAQLVGVFKLENKRGSESGFPESDRAAVREIASDIAHAVHFQILLDHHVERLMQVPAQMVESLLRPFDPRQLVHEVVSTVAESLHAEICSLWLVDPSGKELRLADGIGFQTEARRRQTYNLADPSANDGEIDGITAWVAVRKKPFWANSWDVLKNHPSWRGKWDKAMWEDRAQKFRCLFAVPLLRQHAIIGVLKVENRIGEAFFTATDRALCGIMASLIVLVLELGHELRTSVIADMAHLVRSPIGQIPMNLAVLEGEINEYRRTGTLRLDRIDTYLNIIKRALASAVMTSRELAAVSRKAGYVVGGAPREQVILADLVRKRTNEIGTLLYNDVRVKSHVDASLAACSVALDVTDETRVQIAIDNILHNAIKYSKQGGLVSVRLKREGDDAVLEIEDRGCGISEVDLPRVWEPNFSRRAHDHPQGTGMGLTMVRQVFDGLGWKCGIHSVVDKGTTVTVRIPLA